MGKWTKEEKEYLKQSYSTTDTNILVDRLNKDLNNIYVMAKRLGLRKTKEVISAVTSRNRSMRKESNPIVYETVAMPSWCKSSTVHIMR